MTSLEMSLLLPLGILESVLIWAGRLGLAPGHLSSVAEMTIDPLPTLRCWHLFGLLELLGRLVELLLPLHGKLSVSRD